MNPHHATRLGHHFPCCLIAYRKNPLIGLNYFFPDVVFEPVGEFLWDEDEFLLPATLGVSEGQSSFSNVRRVSFSTSLILIPPLAISSSINRFLGFDVLKMISSTVSFSMMSQ
jgi:hypothetical protein